MKYLMMFLAGVLWCSFVAEAAPEVKLKEKSECQCWAVTQSGTRCKRRARPNERYCKQHAAAVVPKKSPDQCRSMTGNGSRCTAKPLPGKNYCEKHLH